MAERFTSDLLFILLALLVAAALGYVIGYLYCKSVCNKNRKVPFNAEEAKRVFGKKIMEDDLAIVEGIGEKIATMLKDRGIDTWLKLSETTPAEIREILDVDGGSTYKMHDPKTWPEQAHLASAGKWELLKTYQDMLKAGRESN